MPNKTNDWFERLLDRHPSEPVPTHFLQRLHEQISKDTAAEGEKTAGLDPSGPMNLHREPTVLRILRPMLVAAAAMLLVGVGYLLGAGNGPEFQQITIHPGGELAQGDLEQIFENREILQSWDLTSDADLELVFRELANEQDDWVGELLTESTPAENSGSETSSGEGETKDKR